MDQYQAHYGAFGNAQHISGHYGGVVGGATGRNAGINSGTNSLMGGFAPGDTHSHGG